MRSLSVLTLAVGAPRRVRDVTALLSLVLLLCAPRALLAFECTRAGVKVAGVTAEILASDGSDYVASRADCQCGFPLQVSIVNSAGAPVLAGAVSVDATCSGGGLKCITAEIRRGGAELRVLLPALPANVCDKAPTLTVTLSDPKNAMSPLSCALDLAAAFARPSFPTVSNLTLLQGEGQLILLAQRGAMSSSPGDMAQPGQGQSIAKGYQLLCRSVQTGAAPVQNKGALFSGCRGGLLVSRGSIERPLQESPLADLGLTDLGDGGDGGGAMNDGGADLQDAGDLLVKSDMTQRDASGAATQAVWGAADPDPGFVCSESLLAFSPSQSLTISGLTSEGSYEVVLVASDARGNAAVVSQVFTGTPLKKPANLNFACGCALGGRQAAPPAGSAVILLLAAGLCLRRRPERRARRLHLTTNRLALLVGVSALAASSAQAAPIGLQINLKFGAYAPQLLTTPAADPDIADRVLTPGQLKGDGAGRRLISQLELDYLPLGGRFGQLGLGVVGGYSKISGYRPRTASGSPKDSYCTRENGTVVLQGSAINESLCLSNQETTVQVIPLQGLLVYRLDTLDRKYGVPLIPYLKGGLAFHCFDVTGSSKWGATLGMVVLAGLALNLGALEPKAQMALRRDFGIDRVTLFLEYSGSWINGFGGGARAATAPTLLDLSEQGFNGGLGVEL